MDDDRTTPDDQESTVTVPSASLTPSRIGPYKILQKLGEGGMGVVYLAEQEHPIRRRVALKIIKLGMDTKAVIARFEAERQALALMDHPAIAKVYDAGATPQGRPYFVMEYVKGVPVTEHCDRQRLTTKERLRLFTQVCEGVQHAHQKGIIHRDLKPSNVLVTIEGERAAPKIIDFGVVKATEQRLAEQTVFTQIGQVIGTPEYMSPEQAEMTTQDIDTRTDVYSLGVVLYELLVGALPFEPKELRQAGFDEIRRKIREEEPSRPSTRVSGLGEESTGSAEKRQTDPASLIRQLRGDLDWITMRALEKNRARRYGSPSDLAEDIRRHLRHEPVVAGPPSTRYRARKFVRRHRVGVISAAVTALALVIGMAGTTIGFVRAGQAKAEARREAATAEQVVAFLVSLFEVSDPSETRGKTITAKEILDRGARTAQEELGNQPQVQARLMATMGSVYHKLGLYGQSQLLQERSLAQYEALFGRDHPNTLKVMSDLARLYRSQGRWPDAESLCSQVVEARGAILGKDHPDTLASMHDLAILYYVQGRNDKSEPLYLAVIQARNRVLGEAHPSTLRAVNDLSRVYISQDRFNEAEQLLTAALRIQRHALGDDHPDTLLTMGNLAGLYRHQNRYTDAEPLQLETLATRRRVLGNDHSTTLVALSNLVALYSKQGRHEEAYPLVAELIERRRELASQATADPRAKNEFAWIALTCEPAELRDPQSAFDFALEANVMTAFENAEFLDTLALAYYRMGDTPKAVATQKKALALLPEGASWRGECAERLAEFEAALQDKPE